MANTYQPQSPRERVQRQIDETMDYIEEHIPGLLSAHDYAVAVFTMLVKIYGPDD